MRNPFRRAQKAEVPPAELKSGSFLVGMGPLRMMANGYDAFASEGYSENPVVNACVDKIATAMSSVDIILYQRDRKTGKLAKVEGEHPLLSLIANRPNPTTSGRTFIDTLARYWLIGGNAYIFAARAGKKPPAELYLLLPSKVTVKKNDRGPFPLGYDYKPSMNQATFYPVDQLTGASPILHIKTFNPLDQWNGLSPMLAASVGIDVFNAGQKWNLRLLQNEARPSGAMVVKAKDGSADFLTEEQYQRMREQIDAQFSGAANAGRPMLLEGGLDWREMSLSAKDMDHQNNMTMAARSIAGVYGVPPMLVNVPGEATYANYEQARMALWTDTVLPKLSYLLDELNRWLTPLYGDNLELWYDEEMIPALEPLRKEKADRINAANYMRINEQRRAMGLDDVQGGDTILVPYNEIPLDLVDESTRLQEPGAPGTPPQNPDSPGGQAQPDQTP